MIRSFRHKGLRRLYEDDNPRGIFQEHVLKLRKILAVLDAASEVGHIDLPGFNLHPLEGALRGFWAITVRANWRVVFRFEESHACDVDYLDYH